MTRQLPFTLAAVLLVLAFAALAPAQSGAGRPTSGQSAQPVMATPPAHPAAPVTARPSAPVPPQTGSKPPAAAKPSTPPETPGETGYSYRPDGRRDPFVSLWNPGTSVHQRAMVEGLPGIYTVDLTVKGILQTDGKFVAIVLGPDAKRQYILHTNDRLADGVVKAITADSVLILQEVSDPLSLAKQREIRKTLRAVEEVK